ncbi:glycoside hydrolase [Lacihabitans sp. LS3-19]|uniref:glycoside hydrolase family 10 protein n=1 Tax=Lacihabitans sp. LS3-19 TaxID=2487335 RepID=UPI0020CF548A|nr:family 10 glycosylhydrolase [Lacihabitans sp. LS3-19]MCP9770052.1 glycoside hydrolase [Lacihabitans sp. LS3-19]
MKNRKLLVILVVILGQCTPKSTPKQQTSILQDTEIPNKREFRAAWVATIENIDWPSRKTLSTDQQQNEFVSILEMHQKTGLNAVLVQVRAASDAFYARSNEPWSEWLTGTQGKAPEPYYDPMRFMIEEAHSRNMEFHAWLNLNRGTQRNAKSVARDNITNLHPDWFLSYGGYKLYNFGLPQVREYLVELVTNMVKAYDLDGIHFDDYFYPYAVAGETLEDGNAFKKYGRGFDNIEEWRRHNIDLLIKDISDAIKHEKKWVKFGISPFGVWRNASKDKEGSMTEAGQTSYDNLYADTRKWAKYGWIDYIAPQVYFAFDHPKVPYKTLVDWWKDNHGNRNLYIGHSAYKVDKESKEKSWRSASQIGKQIRYNHSSSDISGSIFFSTKSLTNRSLGISDTLKQIYKYPVLQPIMPWKDNIPPNNPAELEAKRVENIGAVITWKMPEKVARDRDEIQSFVLYRFEENEVINLENPKKIVSIIRNVGILSYADNKISKKTSYFYVITALDRLHNESSPSNQFFLK